MEGGGKHPPPSRCYTSPKSPVLIGLSRHRDKDLNMDDIISRFARKNERRMSLISILDTDLPEK